LKSFDFAQSPHLPAARIRALAISNVLSRSRWSEITYQLRLRLPEIEITGNRDE